MDIVLVWAGIELLSFLAAGRVLCFEFGMRLMLITHWCFSHCWAVLAWSQGNLDSHTALSERRLWEHKELGGIRTRTAGPNKSRRCPTPYSIIFNNKTGWVGWGAAIHQGLAGHQSASGGWLHHAPLVYFFSTSFLIKFSVFQSTRSYVSLFSSFLWHGRGVCKWLCSSELSARLSHNTYSATLSWIAVHTWLITFSLKFTVSTRVSYWRKLSMFSLN